MRELKQNWDLYPGQIAIFDAYIELNAHYGSTNPCNTPKITILPYPLPRP